MTETPQEGPTGTATPRRRSPAAAAPPAEAQLSPGLAPQWEYLEVTVDLNKKGWRDSSGRRRRLPKGQTADVLAEVGREGWELAGTWAIDSEEARLFFKRPLEDAPRLSQQILSPSEALTAE